MIFCCFVFCFLGLGKKIKMLKEYLIVGWWNVCLLIEVWIKGVKSDGSLYNSNEIESGEWVVYVNNGKL